MNAKSIWSGARERRYIQMNTISPIPITRFISFQILIQMLLNFLLATSYIYVTQSSSKRDQLLALLSELDVDRDVNLAMQIGSFLQEKASQTGRQVVVGVSNSAQQGVTGTADSSQQGFTGTVDSSDQGFT